MRWVGFKSVTPPWKGLSLGLKGLFFLMVLIFSGGNSLSLASLDSSLGEGAFWGEPPKSPSLREVSAAADGRSPPRVRNLWINTRKEYAEATNSIARKGQGTKSLAECRDSVPAGVQRQRLWGLPSY